MKISKFVGVSMLLMAAISLVSCSETTVYDPVDDESGSLKSANLQINISNDLTDEEIEGLVFMREEEKLARDVYLKLYEIHEMQVFDNIATSEETHTETVLSLLVKYGIADPALPQEGKFSTPFLQDLYDDLVSQGSSSPVAALTVGATIEDLDINDLTNILVETQSKDLITVYENLKEGSENHMRAFVSALEALGQTYVPQFISTETFEAILADSNSSGKDGNGSTGKR